MRCALVSGASRGIGRAVAARLAREGWAVAVNYLHHRQEAEALVRDLQKEGCWAQAYPGDVADKEAVEAMAAQAREDLGPIELLVNNAGIAVQALFQDITDAQWQRILSVNLGGARNCIQAVLPQMIRRQQGCIINLSSIWGLRGASCEAAYACTKAGLIGLTRSLAMELGPSHIRVNCVAPGVIDTDMNRPLGPQVLSDLADETPLGRLGTPEDVAAAVAFLASRDAAFITGQVLTADGGFCL